jgi:hypothetical protein
MNEPDSSVLSLMVEQFATRHQGRLPKQIVLTPLALLTLAIKRSVAPYWKGVSVVCREIEEDEATTTNGDSIAVFVKPEGQTARLVSCDLKTKTTT